MGEFFHFLSTGLYCLTVFAIASVVALSLPQSKLRTILREFLSWGAVVLCALYVVAPVDFLPEAALGPFGLLDDAGVAYAAWLKLQEGLKLRRERLEWDQHQDDQHDKAA